MKRYFPFIVTSRDQAARILNGEMLFKPAIPSNYGGRDDYLTDLLSTYPMEYIKQGLGYEIENRAIVDLSDFSSTVFTLYELSFDDTGKTIPPDERIISLGDTAIIITNPQEFFARVCYANDMKYQNIKNIQIGRVDYDDDLFTLNVSNDVFDPFVHGESESWKKEIMIVSRVKESIIMTEDIQSDDTFYIPNGIADISVTMSIDYLFSGEVNNELKDRLGIFDGKTKEEQKEPIIIESLVTVAAPIKDIVPNKEWIDKFKTFLDMNTWKPITRMVSLSPDEEEIPCLVFIKTDNSYAEIRLMVDTIAFSFNGDFDAELISRVIDNIESIMDILYCRPSVMLVADVGNVNDCDKFNNEFGLRKTKKLNQGVCLYELCVRSRMLPDAFNIQNPITDRWLLKEQRIVLEDFFWYKEDEIIRFINKSRSEIMAHFASVIEDDIVTSILAL